jgi:hypothetical protein
MRIPFGYFRFKNARVKWIRITQKSKNLKSQSKNDLDECV